MIAEFLAEYAYSCAICERGVRDFYVMKGNECSLPPLCRHCEGYYGGRPLPAPGAFLDRRKARQVNALAEALAGRAGVMEWERRHA